MKYDFHKTRALIVDDFSQMRKAFRHMLENFGLINIDEASNGSKAVALMQKNHYDLVLCDYNLGEDEKNGQQILEEVKHRNFVGYSTIFIMITAEASTPWVMGAVEHLPDDYLVKPITKDVLRLRLQKLTDKKKSLSPIQQAIKQKDFDLAIEACDAALEKDAKNKFEIQRIRSDIYLRMGNFTAAERTYEMVMEERPLPWAMLGLGQVQFYQENYSKAVSIFEGIIAKNDSYMPAYDWLSKTLKAAGDTSSAQEILGRAIKHSPISLHRQKEMGELAYTNEDFETAARSYRAAVRLGNQSIFREATDFTGLAKSLAHKGTSMEAMKIIESAKREFKRDDAALCETSMSESIIYNKMGLATEAKEAAERANDHRMRTTGNSLSDTSLEFAKACFECGSDELAEDILKDVIKSNHDNKIIANKVGQIFEEAGLGESGRELISSVRKEMVTLNNRGVQLVEENKLDEAVELFIEAAEGLPLNQTINLNAAQALAQHIKQNGLRNDYLEKAREYLGRVESQTPYSKKLVSITRALSKLALEPQRY